MFGSEIRARDEDTYMLRDLRSYGGCLSGGARPERFSCTSRLTDCDLDRPLGVTGDMQAQTQNALRLVLHRTSAIDPV